MREIDPFDYFPGHGSAIRGFGGDRRSPDPNFCFHTKYIDVRPGVAFYELRIADARAREGELSVRVHAFKPSTGGNASLVTAGRLDLFGHGEGDLSLRLRFVAMPDVTYALYGLFTAPSDLTARELDVALDEPEDGAMDIVEPPHSAMALREEHHDVRPANALIHGGELFVDEPVSQDCTKDQLATLVLFAPNRPTEPSQGVMAQWCESVCLAALPAYGVDLAGLDGLVLGPVGPDMHRALDQQPFVVTWEQPVAPVPGSDKSVDNAPFVDFLMWPHVPNLGENWTARWDFLEMVLMRLKIAGVGVLCLRYRPDTDLRCSSQAVDSGELTRNEINQWALRLIGRGYSVAPLGFAPGHDLVVDEEGMAICSFVVRRK